METRFDPLKSTSDLNEVENRIHRDFRDAFAAWEEAPEEQKAEAYLLLNNTVRQLYEFVVRGKLPQKEVIAGHSGSANAYRSSVSRGA